MTKRDISGEIKKERLVLAYSGGLDTSVILAWLVEKGFDVICFCADVGQGDEDFEGIKAKALKCGASKCYIEDLRKEFVVEFVYPAVKSNAIYESRYLLGTSLARPVITRAMVRVANAEGAKYLGHGATGKGNDQVRFEMCALALDASLEMVAPWRDPEFLEKFKGRKDLLEYAAAHGIHVDATPKAPYSIDANLYHNSYESGMLEDPMTPPLKEMFELSVDPEDAPDKAAFLSIEFTEGVPVKVVDKADNKVYTDPLESFLFLNKIAGANAIGRIDIVENRFVGIKSRGVYETPAGTLLREAHLDIEGITMDREVMRVRDVMSDEFARLAYNGYWFAPEMDMVMNSIDYSQKHVTGTVHLKLYKGNITVMGREAPNALYSEELASMDIEDGGNGLDYNPMDSQGFIRINAVRLRASKVRETLAAKK
jgi:argininosuccinate synthase